MMKSLWTMTLLTMDSKSGYEHHKFSNLNYFPIPLVVLCCCCRSILRGVWSETILVRKEQVVKGNMEVLSPSGCDRRRLQEVRSLSSVAGEGEHRRTVGEDGSWRESWFFLEIDDSQDSFSLSTFLIRARLRLGVIPPNHHHPCCFFSFFL